MSENVYLIIGSWILVILAAERTTEIISDSKFFFPLRNWLTMRALSENTDRSSILYVIACNNILIKWLGLVGTINLWHAIFRLIFRGRVTTIDIKHTIVLSDNELDQLGIVIGDEDGKT